MKKLVAITFASLAPLSFGAKLAEASVGSRCTKAGVVNTATGLKCIKRKGKLIWTQFYSAPGKVSVVVFTPSNLSLVWGSPEAWGNPVATFFVVQVRSGYSPNWVTVAELTTDNRSATVSGLIPGVGYEFRVAARNSYGVGEFAYSQLSYVGTGTTATTTTIAGTTTTSTTTTTVSSVSVSQSQAVKKAASYLSSSAFSRDGLIKQLQYEGFSLSDAVYGVDAQNADWNAQAVKKGASYLRSSAFSRSGLINQLEYSGFSNAEATYGTDSQNADWNAQAAKKAASYLRSSSFSRSGLINQLLYEGFTQSQAEYGVNSVGL